MTNVQKILNRYKTSKDIVEAIDRMEVLLRMYRTKVKGPCPLCVAGCLYCPWDVLMGVWCVDYIHQHLDIPVFRVSTYELRRDNRRWQQLRRRQLPRWIKYYKEALIEKGRLSRLPTSAHK